MPIAECLLQPDAPPLLGICYGMQQLARQLGGKVTAADTREFGPAVVRARGHSNLLKDIQDRNNDQGHGLLDVWMSHGDQVTELPPGYKRIASTEAAPIAGMADENNRRYGLQFSSGGDPTPPRARPFWNAFSGTLRAAAATGTPPGWSRTSSSRYSGRRRRERCCWHCQGEWTRECAPHCCSGQ